MSPFFEIIQLLVCQGKQSPHCEWHDEEDILWRRRGNVTKESAPVEAHEEAEIRDSRSQLSPRKDEDRETFSYGEPGEKEEVGNLNGIPIPGE